MEIGIVRDEEIAIAGAEARSVRFQNMASYFVQIKQGREQIVLEIIAQNPRSIAGEAAGSRRPKMRQHRHEVASAFVTVEHVVHLSIDPAVDRVDDAVALPAFRMLQKCGGEEALAAGRESDLDRIIHPPGHDRLNPAASRTAPKDIGGPSDECWLACALIGLTGE